MGIAMLEGGMMKKSKKYSGGSVFIEYTLVAGLLMMVVWTGLIVGVDTSAIEGTASNTGTTLNDAVDVEEIPSLMDALHGKQESFRAAIYQP